MARNKPIMRKVRVTPVQDPETKIREIRDRVASAPSKVKKTFSIKAARAKVSTTQRDVRRRLIDDPNKSAIERVRGDRTQLQREANRRSSASRRGAKKRKRS